MPIRPIRPAAPAEPVATREISPRRRTRPVAATPDPAFPPEGRDYAIGYGKPPTATRFMPGRSGNPRGRPKGAKGLKTITKALLSEKVTVRTGAGQKKVSRIEALVMKLIEQAAKGDFRSLQALMALHMQAVPEIAAQTSTDAGHEQPLSATDEAILAELKAQLMGDGA